MLLPGAFPERESTLTDVAPMKAEDEVAEVVSTKRSKRVTFGTTPGRSTKARVSMALQKLDKADLRYKATIASDQAADEGSNDGSEEMEYDTKKIGRLQEEAEASRNLFVDPNQLKDKVRSALIKNKYNVKNFYKTTGIPQLIAKNPLFETLTMMVVIANSVWIWVDADLNNEPILAKAQTVFQVFEHAFCTYFVLEWCIRWLSFQATMYAFKDSWFMFDSILLVLTVTETWVLTLVFVLGSAGRASMGLDASVLKVCRVMRLTRMARMARLLRYMPELLIILRGLWIASKSVFFTLILLLFTIFVFGITFRQLTDGTPVGERYFYSVHGSMISLFLHGTQPDLAEMVLVLGDQNLGLGILLVLFILMATLTIMNMLVGVLVESVATVSTIENETIMVNMVRAKMLQMIEVLQLDIDGNGSLSRNEFEELLVMPEAAQFIQGVGVDVVGLVEYADFLFREDREMSFADFVELILQLRGTNQATVKDIVDLRKQVMLDLECIRSILTERSEEAEDRASLLSTQLMPKEAELEVRGHSLKEQEKAVQLVQPLRPQFRPSQVRPQVPRALPPLLNGPCPLPLDDQDMKHLKTVQEFATSWNRLAQYEV